MDSHQHEQKIVIYWNTKKTISLICAILIVPVLVVFLFSMTLKQTIINPKYYKNNLKKVDAYNRLIQEGIPSLITETKLTKDTLTEPLAKRAVIFIIKKVIDPEWVESLTNGIIDQTANYFAKPNQTISVNLAQAKDILTQTSDGLILLEQIIPSCTQAQATSEATKPLLNVAIDCQGISLNLDEFKQNIKQIRTEIDSVNLSVVRIDQNIAEANSFIRDIQKLIRNINLYFWVSLILLIALTLMIILMEFKNLPLLVKFLSLPIIIASFLTFLVALIISSPAQGALEGLNFGLPAPMQSIVNDVFMANISGIFCKLELAAGLFLAIFAALYIAVIILQKYGFKFFGYRG